jgi:hypothetical protein
MSFEAVIFILLSLIAVWRLVFASLPPSLIVVFLLMFICLSPSIPAVFLIEFILSLAAIVRSWLRRTCLVGFNTHDREQFVANHAGPSQ